MMICESIKDRQLDAVLTFTISAKFKYDNKITQETLKIANVLYSKNIKSIPKFWV